MKRRDFIFGCLLSIPAFMLYSNNEINAGAFHRPLDPNNMTEDERIHVPQVTLPPVIEDGNQAPIIVEMDHPMEEDHYIKSIQILNFADPIVTKGKFFFTPTNGEAYLSTQIRL